LILEIALPLIIGINEIIIGLQVTKKTNRVPYSHNLLFTSLSKKTENLFKNDKRMTHYLLFQRTLLKIFILLQIVIIITRILMSI